MAWYNPLDWTEIDEAAGEAWGELTDFVGAAVTKARGGQADIATTPAKAVEAVSAVAAPVAAVTKPVVDTYKGTTRIVTTAADFPLEVLNNASAFAYNSPYLRYATPVPQIRPGKGFKEAEASTIDQLVGIVTNTKAFQAAKDALPGGEDVDLGSGFFPGGETVRQVNERKKELYPTLYGSTFTVGRAGASILADNGVIEPGGTMYNAISGAIDAGWTMGADPVNWIPAGSVLSVADKFEIPLTVAARAGKRARVTTTLSKKAEKIIEKAAEAGRIVLNDAGLIEGARRSVNPNNWEAFKLTERGQRWLESFAADKSGTAAQIWRRSGGQIPPRTAARLEKAQTIDEVINVLDDAVYTVNPLDHVRIMPGIDPRPIVTKTGAIIKGNATRYRPFFDTLPESTDFPLNNPSKAAKNADAVMAQFDVPLETRNEYMTKLFKAYDSKDDQVIFDWLNDFERNVVAKRFRDFNYSEEEITKMTRWRERYADVEASFITDTAGSTVPLPWMLGGPNGGYGPLFYNQTLRVNPILVDPNDVYEFADKVGPLRRHAEAYRRKVIDMQPVVDPQTGEIIYQANIEVVKRKGIDTALAVADSIGNSIDFVNSRIWKPNVLLRPRWFIRTIPDEWARGWATGMVEHPGQYLVQIATNRNAVDLFGETIITARQATKIEARMLEAERIVRRANRMLDAGETTMRGRSLTEIIAEQSDIALEASRQLEIYDERIAAGLNGINEGLIASTPSKAKDLLLSANVTSTLAKRGYVYSAERVATPNIWAKALAQRVAERASQDYVRHIAKELSLGKTAQEIATDLYRNPKLAKLKASIQNYVDNLGNKNPSFVWDEDGYKVYVQEIVNDVKLLSLNDDEILQAIATGKFRDETLLARRGYDAQGKPLLDREPNATLKQHILDNHQQNPAAPERVNYFPSIYDKDKELRDVVGKQRKFYDGLLSFFFDDMYGLASDKLARNVMWHQAKWQRVIELMPLMDPEEAKALVKTVEKTNIAPTIKADIKEMADIAAGDATRQDIEMAAELFATKFNKELYFDASRKTKFGAAHRKLFSFYDAFVELTGSALKMATNPRVLHGLDKVVGELRQNTFFPGPGDIDGDGKQEGFLYRDPVSGEEMYSLPAPPGFLRKWKQMGLDFSMANTLNSLSLVTTAYPSLSPMVSMALNSVIPDRAEYDKLRELIAPYGVPDLSTSDAATFLIQGYSESWNRILGSSGIELLSKVENRQKAAQMIMRAMVSLASVKDYDPYTPGQQGPMGAESIEQWQADGKELGVKLYGLTGWGQLFMPGAPIAQFHAKTKMGNVLFGVLSNRWQEIDKMGDEAGLEFQDKLEQFVNEIGNEALVALLQPVTDRSVVGSTSTKEYQDWYRGNKDIADKYDRVAGYFSPRSSEMDVDIWNLQRLNGQVDYKDPEDFAKNVESAWANFQFNKRLREFEDSLPVNLDPKQRDSAVKGAKKQLAKAVQQAYPNWDRAASATQAQKERRIQIDQVKRMIEEPTLQDNPVVAATKEYLNQLDVNLKYVMARDPKVNEDNWKTMSANKRAIALREAMWEKGEELAQRYPDFVNLWQNVLSRDFISVDIED